MSENAKTPASEPAPADPAEVKKQLLAKAVELEKQIKMLELKVNAFDQRELQRLKVANEAAEKSLTALKTLTTQLAVLAGSRSTDSDWTVDATALRDAAALFFTQMKVNPDQWKNLVS